MFRRLAAAAALVVSLAACSDATLPAAEPVDARAAGNATLAITNRTGQPVYYQVMDPSKFAIFYGCTPDLCPRLDAGKTVRVPYAEIAYYEPGSAQAMVDWFTFERAADGTWKQTAYGSVLAGL